MTTLSKPAVNPMAVELRKNSSDVTRLAICKLLSDLPVQFNERGSLSFHEDADNGTFLSAAHRLYDLNRSTNTMCNFFLGDIWNYWGQDHRTWVYRQLLIARIVGDDKARQRRLSRKMSNYGWVASKWPNNERADYSWYWSRYVKTDPESLWKAEHNVIPAIPTESIFAVNKADAKDTASVVVTYSTLEFEVRNKLTGEIDCYELNSAAYDRVKSRIRALVEGAIDAEE